MINLNQISPSLWYESIWGSGAWWNFTKKCLGSKNEKKKDLQTETAVWFNIHSKKLEFVVGFNIEFIWSNGAHSETYSFKVTALRNGCPNKKFIFFYIEPQRADAQKIWQSNLSLRTVKYFCGFFVVNALNMLMKSYNVQQKKITHKKIHVHKKIWLFWSIHFTANRPQQRFNFE